MSTRILDKAEWQGYLDRISKELGASLVEVEVAGLDIGDQMATDWITFAGISYDPKDDVVAVDMVSKDGENVEHLIHEPVEFTVDETAEGIASIAFMDADNHRQIIRLKKPLLLPGSNAA